MPLIYLERLQVFSSFDSSHTSSSVSRGVAQRLHNIKVFCYPVEDSISVSCLLNFRIDHNLREGCILGVDYFAQIFPELCELFEFYGLRVFQLLMLRRPFRMLSSKYFVFKVYD